MSIFQKGKKQELSYDKETQEPVIKASICTGEQVAGFRDRTSGKFEDIMLIQSPKDLELFKSRYGIRLRPEP